MRYTIGVILLMSFHLGWAQDGNEMLQKNQDSITRPTSIEIGTGFRIGKFRDFATSPLFYSGIGLAGKIGRVKKNNKLETDLNLMFAGGNYFTIVENEVHSSAVNSLFLNYSYLKGIERLASERIFVMVGGAISATGNYRFNESLMNNNLGLEGLINLQVSGKITFDVSRREKKKKKFLFIPYTLEPRNRNLSYRLDVGVVNSSYRNGYAYASQGVVTNRDGLNVFDNHKFTVFSGMRLGSCLAYEINLNNGNRVKFAYQWDAYKTGGDLDVFEMSNHFLQVALLFKAN